MSYVPPAADLLRPALRCAGGRALGPPPEPSSSYFVNANEAVCTVPSMNASLSVPQAPARLFGVFQV